MENYRFGCAKPYVAKEVPEQIFTNNPCVIEGAEVIDTLLPVNKLTGHRGSLYKLLGKITGAKSDLLNSVLQELPVLRSDASLTDEQRVEMLVPRLASGSPAEDALMAEMLMKNVDVLFPKAENKPDSSKIEFTPADSPDVKNE